MIAVIFEVFPQPENKQEYLDIAKELKPLLSTIDGFISIERFESLQTPGKVLSLSYWENEEAIKQWRNQTQHREGQGKGMDHIFSNFNIKVCQVIRDYGLNDRENAPSDSNQYHLNKKIVD
ncbi:antibiotic biosynthesis monooxygenase family protein [Flammeovirga pacifica]|uniref:Antibiotic biosynthesis monooxygenase n=1 Tax=Flammeovirga pacifica TaxID=915059 RepID=A0A1S1YVP3_FLAPC|nr:antibiotic biosynthesis monooxygenase [Flammeovirga pacifica]OHX64895.1 antibiotic biosynthesis monooxygenase [Flammeovirga pacifica]